MWITTTTRLPDDRVNVTFCCWNIVSIGITFSTSNRWQSNVALHKISISSWQEFICVLLFGDSRLALTLWIDHATIRIYWQFLFFFFTFHFAPMAGVGCRHFGNDWSPFVSLLNKVWIQQPRALRTQQIRYTRIDGYANDLFTNRALECGMKPLCKIHPSNYLKLCVVMSSSYMQVVLSMICCAPISGGTGNS